MPAPYERRMRLVPGGCPAFAGPGRRPGLLLCLAPHGVFRAPALARRAVGSYPAFSPLPDFPCGSQAVLFSVTLSVVPGLGRGTPVCCTRHVALRCSDFPPGGRERRRAIVCPPQRDKPTPFQGNGKQGIGPMPQSVATRNHPIITTAITNFPAIPAAVPRKVPQAERPAGSSPLPPSNSPSSTPASGPTNSPSGP